MLTPANRTINVTSGGTALVGRTTAIGGSGGGGTGPAWAANAPLNAWMEIPGTTVVPQEIAQTYSGMAVTPAGRIVVAESGGHADGSIPFVYGIDLGQDAPAWSYLKARAASYIPEQPYVQSGEPSTRHTYQTPQYIPALNAVMMTGCYAVPTSSNSSFPTIEAFYLGTNQWAAPGTFGYADVPTGSYPGPNGGGVYPTCGSTAYPGGMRSSTMTDEAGNIWAGAVDKFNPLTKTWSVGATLAGGVDSVTDIPRFPWCLDSVRNEHFGMCFGDGQGSSTFLGLLAVRRKAGLVQKVTFNASTAKDAYIAEAPSYCAMTFDPTTGWYYHSSGNSNGNGSANRVYVIKPNSGLVWDIEIMTTTGGINCHPSGLHNRFQYVPSLGGIVSVPATGRGVFFLRTSTLTDPSWLAGKPLNEWFPIAGTNNLAITAPMIDKGGLVVVGKKLYNSLSGGGNGTQSNRTISIDLSANSPTWQTLIPDSASPTANTAYNPDGRPASRHNNSSMDYCPQTGRIMYVGVRYVFPGAVSFQNVDALNLSTMTWDAAKSWADIPVPGAFAQIMDCDGHFWTANGTYRFKPETNTWDSPITAPSSADTANVRAPYACDPSRRHIFGLSWGDDEGYGINGVTAIKWSLDGNSSQAITINPSAAYAQFQAAVPYRSAMVYVPELDKYLHFNGQAGQEGVIYTITPNSGTAWDMGVLAQGSGSAVPPQVPPIGINHRFVYVSALKCLIVMPRPHYDEPLYAMRIA